MSGVQLANKLKEVNKDVQIFLMSAFEFNEDHPSDLKEIELKDFGRNVKIPSSIWLVEIHRH